MKPRLARAAVHRVVGLALASAPAVALAAGAEHEGAGHGGSPLWHAVNLVLLIGLLVYFGRNPVRAFFASRRREIELNLQRSAALLSEAETRLAEWKRRMLRLDQEVAEIQTGARDRAEAERQGILADAHAAAGRIQRDATAAIERETQRAREELRQQAAQLALDLAGDLIHQRMNDQDRTRLVDEFIQQVEAPSAASPGG